MPYYLKTTSPCLYVDDLKSDLNNIRNWIAKNKLQHHPTESKLMLIRSSYNLNNKAGDNPVLLNNVAVPRFNTYKCLGAEINEKLSWEKQIETMCNKASAGIGTIRLIKPYVPVDSLQTIHKALVQPYFDYCSPLWDNCGKLLQDKLLQNKLQKFQFRAAGLITGANNDVR